MARTIKEEEYTTRRNEILASAQKLVLTKGYEQMSIQDILDDLHISKGAFYHYFSAKHDLLEGLIFQRMEGVEKIITPIVQDETLSGLEKLRAYFSSASDWKQAQKPFFMDLLEVWYNDDNAIMRQKTMARMVVEVTPWLDQIIQQGIREGTFKVTYPHQISAVLLAIFQGYSETIVLKLREYNHHPGDPQDLADSMGAYNEAVERLLGMEPGTLKLVDYEMLRPWTVSASEKAGQVG